MKFVLEAASNLPRKTGTLLRPALAGEVMRNQWRRMRAVATHKPMPASLTGCPVR